jgi:branched-chain amino acid transport system substrate-binding protein
MSKRLVTLALTLTIIAGALGTLPAAVAQDDCNFADEIVIGVIAPLTGDIPKVGQSTVEAAQMAVDEVNAACGIEIDGENYEVSIVVEDNETARRR